MAIQSIVTAPAGSANKRNVRDYWAIGAAVTGVVIGIDVDLHPLQMAEFAAGRGTAGFLADDFASTRALPVAAARGVGGGLRK